MHANIPAQKCNKYKYAYTSFTSNRIFRNCHWRRPCELGDAALKTHVQGADHLPCCRDVVSTMTTVVLIAAGLLVVRRQLRGRLLLGLLRRLLRRLLQRLLAVLMLLLGMQLELHGQLRHARFFGRGHWLDLVGLGLDDLHIRLVAAVLLLLEEIESILLGIYKSLMQSTSFVIAVGSNIMSKTLYMYVRCPCVFVGLSSCVGIGIAGGAAARMASSSRPARCRSTIVSQAVDMAAWQP